MIFRTLNLERKMKIILEETWTKMENILWELNYDIKWVNIYERKLFTADAVVDASSGNDQHMLYAVWKLSSSDSSTMASSDALRLLALWKFKFL